MKKEADTSGSMMSKTRQTWTLWAATLVGLLTLALLATASASAQPPEDEDKDTVLPVTVPAGRESLDTDDHGTESHDSPGVAIPALLGALAGLAPAMRKRRL